MNQFDSSSESESQQNNVKSQNNKFAISVLKHLVEARKILEGQSYEHQISKCVYQHPLVVNPSFVVASSANTKNQPLANNKLAKIQETLFEHQTMKQKLKVFFQKTQNLQIQSRKTLWACYSNLFPSYSRFAANPRKNNFANVLIPINGIDISLGSKINEKNTQNEYKNLTNSPDSLRFDSHFQSGNLLYAYRKQNVDIQTYDLILQNDINTKGHNQWFYFKVYNSRKHNRVRFNIINFIKNQSMFSFGIKPLIFSQRNYSKHRVGWVRDGQKINYMQSDIKRECTDKNYYTLSFQYYFQEVDAVYFAPTYPYTHSQLLQYFDKLLEHPSIGHCFCIKNVTQTVGKNTIQILTFSTGKKQIQDCSVAWIIARQHPGQTTSSFIVEGVINYLVQLYSNAQKGQYSQILDSLVFKIIPMINIDGVIHGNTRAQLTGIDSNRLWKKTAKRLSPGVSAIKKLISQTRNNIKLFLDLHSHSKKAGCFFYGNSLMHDPKRTKIYPTLVCSGDQKFQLKHCRFRGGYDTTARSVLFNDLNIEQVFTVECSLLGYLKKNRIVQYKISDYHDIGRKLIQCYVKLEKTRLVKAEKQIIEDLSDKMIDKEDFQSARSQSSLSDEQYQEIKHPNLLRHKKRKKKVNKIETSLLKPQKTQIIDNFKYCQRKNKRINTREDCSINQFKKKCQQRQLSSNQIKSKFNILNIRNGDRAGQQNIKKSETLGETSHVDKLNKRLAQRNMNLQIKPIYSQNKTKMIRQLASINHKQQNASKLSSFLRKQVGSQAAIHVDRYEQKKNKQKNGQLCIVGSSLEEQIVYVAKNEVGVQNNQQVINQALLAIQNNKRSSKMKKTSKILNYLCSNLIGSTNQNNAYAHHEKKLAPLIHKKYLNNSKI